MNRLLLYAPATGIEELTTRGDATRPSLHYKCERRWRARTKPSRVNEGACRKGTVSGANTPRTTLLQRGERGVGGGAYTVDYSALPLPKAPLVYARNYVSGASPRTAARAQVAEGTANAITRAVFVNNKWPAELFEKDRRCAS